MKLNIRAFAVLCVAVIACYIMWIGAHLNDVLAGPDWCRTALGAGKATSVDGTVKGLDSCVSLLTIQLQSVSMNSHIYAGVIAFCLLVLIVVVIAQAKLDLNVTKDGLDTKIGAATPVTVVNADDNPVPVSTEKQ